MRARTVKLHRIRLLYNPGIERFELCNMLALGAEPETIVPLEARQGFVVIGIANKLYEAED